MTGTTSTSRTLEQLARLASELVGVDTSTIVLPDPQAPGGAVAVAGYGGCPALLGRRFSIDDGITDLALALGQPIVIADYQRFPTSVAVVGTQRLTATATIPILTTDRAWGTLSVASNMPGRRYSARDLEQLCELAEVSAVVIEHEGVHPGVERSVEAGVEMLARVMAVRDRPTSVHLERVLRLAQAVGQELALESSALAELGFAARLHDLGKIGIPDTVLRKPAALDVDEWALIKQHPTWGAEMLRHIPGFDSVARVVLHHHEHFDGKGYPDALGGEDIPLASRIISACDAYHAMIAGRPYRAPISRKRADDELKRCAGAQFDPRAVDALRSQVA